MAISLVSILKKFKQKKVIIPLIVVTVIVAGAASYLIFFNKSALKKITRKIAPRPVQVYRCPICGVKTVEENLDKKPLAIMVENSSDVRPQSGSSKACMVFEALAEGGITRFVTVYGGHRRVNKIGPVRSARPYYVNIARGFDALYAHVGGSTRGLQTVADTEIDDFDQFRYEGNFWRDRSIRAPHNVFTSTKLLRRGAKKAAFDEVSDFTGFEFKTKAPKKKPKTHKIGIDFSRQAYYVSYQYIPRTNSYDRYNANYLQRDANNKRAISPKSLIVLFARTAPDIAETLTIEIIGEGKALYFVDGDVTKGVWKKLDASTQLEFYDSVQNPIKLNPGQTWVEVVKTDTKVSY